MARTLRLLEFNVENLFIYLDHYNEEDLSKITEGDWQKLSGSTVENKSLFKTQWLAKTILNSKADIVMLCEVGGLESLNNFNRHFLGDLFEVHLIPGNSDRGIDLGYLVRRQLNLNAEINSHRHRPIDFLYPHEQQTLEFGYAESLNSETKSHKFSRDLLELRLFDKKSNLPVLVCLLVHLKSQLDEKGIDPAGHDRRTAELKKTIEIYKEIGVDLGPWARTVPVILAGDFNGRASLPDPSPEFSFLYQSTELKDVLEWTEKPLSERATYIRINRSGKYTLLQLDYVFISREFVGLIDAKATRVLPYFDFLGNELPYPKSISEKKRLPSDHYPIFLKIDLPE